MARFTVKEGDPLPCFVCEEETNTILRLNNPTFEEAQLVAAFLNSHIAAIDMQLVSARARPR